MSNIFELLHSIKYHLNIHFIGIIDAIWWLCSYNINDNLKINARILYL